MINRSLGLLIVIGAILIAAWMTLTVSGALLSAFDSSSEPEALSSLHSLATLTLRTLAWSIGTALLAMLLGWLPGRVLGGLLMRARHCRRGGAIGATLMLWALLLPLVLPAYVLFTAWWQLWPPGSWVFDALQRWDAITLGRQITLGLALVAWSWPLVALCVAPAAASWPRARSEQLEADGARWWQRLRARWHHDGGGLMLGGLLAGVLVFGNVVCFDLAGIFTLGNELRALAAIQTPLTSLLGPATPTLVVALLGAAFVWWRTSVSAEDADVAVESPRRWVVVMSIGIWTATVALPLTMILVRLNPASIGLWRAHGAALGHDALRSACAGLAGALIVLGLHAVHGSPRRRTRIVGDVITWSWFALLLLPGTLVAAMVSQAVAWLPVAGWRTWMLGGDHALVLALILRYGGLAAVSARWLVHTTPRPLRELAHLHGRVATGPALVGLSIGVGVLTAVLAFGDIPITMRLVSPAAFPPISVTLLNAMHYQRPETVVAVLALLVVGGLVIGLGLSLLRALFVRRGSGTTLPGALLVCLFLIGCSNEEHAAPPPLSVEAVLGGPGHAAGRFDYPRAMAVDDATGEMIVIEKIGRVQHLDGQGSPLHQWIMPDLEHGKPTGVSFGPQGKVWIADTHEHRIMVYQPDGTLLRQFGGYGTGPGEFIYPTDIAFGPGGDVFVSEYGGNDRIQVFTRQGQWLRTLGGPGSRPGEFDRPQSLAIDPSNGGLYVADARNQRIQWIDPVTGAGRVIRQGGFEDPLRIPFGLLLEDDGTLLVSDTGSHLLLRLSPDGDLLETSGGWGWGPGQLRDPWALVRQGDRTLVLDSGNNRILRLRPESPTRSSGYDQSAVDKTQRPPTGP